MIGRRWSRLAADARREWGNLTPFGRMVTSTGPVVVLLLAAALAGMCSRVAPTAIPATPVAAEAASLQSAPILPPADLLALLRGVDEQRAEAGEGGAGSSAFALSVASPAGPSTVAAAGTLTPAEPGLWGPVLTPRQVYGLALYVSDDPWWASFAEGCFTGGGENRGYVGAVNRNADGSLDSGIGQQNDRWHPQVDHERVRRDPVYAMQELYRLYQVSGAGAWLGCSDGGA